MAKQPSENWAKRFEALEDESYKRTDRYLNNLYRQFNQAEKTIQKDLSYWYSKFADNNGISYADAKKLLTNKELKEFKMSLAEFTQKSKLVSFDNDFLREVENASARIHVSRLQSIELQMQATIERLASEFTDSATSFIKTEAETSYYETAFEIAKGTGYANDIRKLNEDTLEKYVTSPWTADKKAVPQRLKGVKDELIQDIKTSVTQNLITGKPIDNYISDVSERFGITFRRAQKIIRTEANAVSTASRNDCFKDVGVERYEIVATLDNRTTEICQEMDGQVFKMSDFKIGLTAPPFHCNCRSVHVPYFNDNMTKDSTRSARDDFGNTYEVPSDMTYNEWYKEFVK